MQARWAELPGSTVVGAASGVLGWLAGLRRSRHVWGRPGRLHIETHGVHGTDGARVARRVERTLEEHPGVHWARVNAPACRVVIGLVEPPPSRRELVALVEAAEAAPASEEEEIAEEELHHPAEGPRPSGLVPRLVADGAALVLAGITRLSPWTPLPPEASGVVSAIELHPRLREQAAERLHGSERAESVLSLTAAAAQALAARGSGVALDIAQRVSQWQGASADQRAWRAAEPHLIGGPDDAVADPVTTERPRRLPDGPAERYQRRALAAGAAVVPAALPLVGPRRAVAAGLAALPKATQTGRTAFSSQLGVVLARNGALVMDRAVLRRLDRVDTLLLDSSVLRWGGWTLTDLLPLNGTDPAEAAEQGFGLFAPHEPRATRHGDGWTLAPIGELELVGRSGAREVGRLRKAGAELVLGLARGRRLEAVLAARAEPARGVEELVRSARGAGLRVVVAGEDPDGADLADAVITTGEGGLRQAVRDLQDDGGVVMLLSQDRRALGAADCGLGVDRDGEPPPWGAHVVVDAQLTTAMLMAEAVAAARRVNRDSIMLAKVATGVGGVGALAGERRVATGRSLGAVNAAAALAFAGGVWRARRVSAPAAADRAVRAPWHLMPPAAVMARLGSDAAGLSSEEAQRRTPSQRRPEALGTSLSGAFFQELANPLTPVLLGGAVLSAVVGSAADAMLVGGITGVSALAGAVQRVRTDRALADLLARAAVGATVRRDGQEHAVTADDLVPGDVVRLSPGDVVPADCRLLDATGMEVDESSVTGESLPVAKDPAPVVAADLADRRSMLYEGTTVANGEAVAVVVATGADTEVGRSMADARRAAPATGIQAQLKGMTSYSLPLAAGAAAAVTAAGLLHRVPTRHSLGAAVSLAVASVPEGLPLLVNAAQLAAARRLAAGGALVRNPRVIEALGRVDVLCFDKTGTLTEGRLSVREVHDGQHGQAAPRLSGDHRAVVTAALRASPNGQGVEQLTHQTDRAVVECAHAAGIDPGAGSGGWWQRGTLPFDPSRGFHATVGRTANGHLLSVKGGTEVVLSRCSSRRSGGHEQPMTDGDLADLTATADRLAGSGHRVLAVAQRSLDTPDDDPDLTEALDDAVQDLVFLGFLTLADPVRVGADAAVARLHEAGVQTVMVTGDHPGTAEAIAAAVQPGNGEAHGLTGSELDELDDEALDRRLAEAEVVARCSPAQKVRIIEAYRRMGKVVAMAGDGANDAPAIRLADVGIALGTRGTPAAQAAADLVVSDDRLESIIAALVEGRAMWASVRQALAILVGGNLGEIAFTVLGAGLTGRSPLNARQLLLVNLLTDLAPALAIALRPPSSHELDDLLRGGPGSTMGDALNREMVARAATTLAGASTAWLAARLTGRSRRAATVSLAALVGTQLGQTLLTGGADRNVLLASLGSAGVLVGAVQTPGVSGFFGCTPLGPVGWGIAASSATAATVAGAVVGKVITMGDKSEKSTQTMPAASDGGTRE